jgi:hypothetical protein
MSGVWDNDDDSGVFDDEESIFGDDSVDQNNPLVSKEYDMQTSSPVANVSGGAEQPVALVAVFDDQGLPMVARHVMHGDRPVQLEEFRRPSPDEYNSIMFGGKIVKGGVVGQDVLTRTGRGLQKTPLGIFGQAAVEEPKWKKVAKIGVGLGVVGGAGYLGWRWWKNRK